MDSMFEFEKKGCSGKYDRELWEKTVEAIKKVETIKAKRQDQFVKNRLKADLKLHDDSNAREVEKGISTYYRNQQYLQKEYKQLKSKDNKLKANQLKKRKRSEL